MIVRTNKEGERPRSPAYSTGKFVDLKDIFSKLEKSHPEKVEFARNIQHLDSQQHIFGKKLALAFL
jgi:hypothetical protein